MQYFSDHWGHLAPSWTSPRYITFSLSAAAVALGATSLTAVLWARRSRCKPSPLAHIPEDLTTVTRVEELIAMSEGRVQPGCITEVLLPETAGLTPALLCTLGCLHALRQLDLGGNDLESLPETLFVHLPSLEVLNLAGNSLTEIPATLGNLSKLRRLGLKSNRLTTLPDSIGNLSELKELYVTDNKLVSLPAALGKLKCLVKLQASFNDLESLPAELAGCAGLELLRVACCRIATLPPELASMPSLCWLSIAGNPVADAIAQQSSHRRVPVISLEQLSLGPKLGSGASGEVWHARWAGREVAVKIFEGDVSPDGRAADEETIACSLADPGLVHVLARLHEPHGLVMALVEGRPMAQKPNHESLLRCRWDPATRISLPILLRAAHDVAAALAYLHAQGISHGDVYAHNVLAGPTGHAVLCDYGAAFYYDQHQAPHFELLEVRAFGLFLQGLLRQLHIGFEDMENVLGMQKALVSLAQSCLHPIPSKRPKFKVLAGCLRSFQLSSHNGGISLREEAPETLRSSRIMVSPHSTESTELDQDS